MVEGEKEDEGVKKEQQNECKAVDHLCEDAQHYNALINICYTLINVCTSDDILGSLMFGLIRVKVAAPVQVLVS